MEAVSRGAKEAGGRTIAITSTFFRTQANAWVDEEHAASTWQERLFELIRFGEGYVACKGGTGTLVELAVVWEMLNKGVMAGKPFVTLGDFWAADHRARPRGGGQSRIALGRGEGATGAHRAKIRQKPQSIWLEALALKR